MSRTLCSDTSTVSRRRLPPIGTLMLVCGAPITSLRTSISTIARDRRAASRAWLG